VFTHSEHADGGEEGDGGHSDHGLEGDHGAGTSLLRRHWHLSGG
jgi:hypothetical protein